MATSASLFPLQCPKCGGPVVYESKKDEYVCHYCGISFKFTSENNKNLRNRLELARDSMDKERYREARRYYREALDYDSNSWEAKLGVASCEVIFSTPYEYNGSRGR